MKVRFFPLLAILLSPMLVACQDTEHSILSINTAREEKYFIDLKTEELTELIDSKQQFVLEVYSPYCSHCANLEEHIIKYSKEKQRVIYRYDLTKIKTEEEFAVTLYANYPDIFPNYNVPAIRFVSNCKLTYEVSSNKFSSYYALSKIMDKHFSKSYITMIGSLNEYESYKKDHSNYVVYAYDLQYRHSLDLAATSLITNEFAKLKKEILLADLSAFEDDFDEFAQIFSASGTYFASTVKDNEQIKTIDYSLDDGTLINDLISLL